MGKESENTTRHIEAGDNSEVSIFDKSLRPIQAAQVLGISDRTLRRQASEWGIPRFPIGRNSDGSIRWRYRYASLIQWMNEREVS
jgi:hypothetical protein